MSSASMSNLISKKDKIGFSCIIHSQKSISSKILLFKESTWNVVLNTEIRGDKVCHKGIHYLV